MGLENQFKKTKSQWKKKKDQVKDLDQKLLALATKSFEQIKKVIADRSSLDLNKDIPKQLAERVLNKAIQIKESLEADFPQIAKVVEIQIKAKKASSKKASQKKSTSSKKSAKKSTRAKSKK